MTVLLVAGVVVAVIVLIRYSGDSPTVSRLVVAVIVLIRYSGDSPTGSRAGSGCNCPHQVQ